MAVLKPLFNKIQKQEEDYSTVSSFRDRFTLVSLSEMLSYT